MKQPNQASKSTSRRSAKKSEEPKQTASPPKKWKRISLGEPGTNSGFIGGSQKPQPTSRTHLTKADGELWEEVGIELVRVKTNPSEGRTSAMQRLGWSALGKAAGSLKNVDWRVLVGTNDLTSSMDY